MRQRAAISAQRMHALRGRCEQKSRLQDERKPLKTFVFRGYSLASPEGFEPTTF